MRAVTTCAGMLALAVIGSACARSRLAESEPNTDPGHAQTAGGGGWGDSAGVPGASAMVMAGGPGPRPGATDAPLDLPSTEVWTGQLWSTTPTLCDPNALTDRTPLVVQPMGYVEPVAMFLDRGSDSTRPSGVIALGRGELPSDPGDAPFATDGSWSFWACSVQIPSRGGVYTLRAAHRSGDRLTFDVAPAEIWSEWCGGDVADCQACDDCLDSVNGNGEVRFDLVVRGDEMQGPSLRAEFGTRSELRLRRVR
jgi:hypothetical protein